MRAGILKSQLRVKGGEDVGAKYLPNFGGWLAFRHGKTVMTRDNRIKVFPTEEAALAAARASNMGFGVRRIARR